MANMRKCPECKHPNAMPAAGTKKITCGGCGMIIVLAKVYGEDWAKAPAPAPAGKPKIVTKRDRMAAAAPEEPAAPAPSAGRRGRGRGRGARDAGEGRTQGRRRGSSGGMPPALIWGSIGAIVFAGLLVGVVVKMNNDKKAEAEIEQARIEKAEKEKAAAAKAEAAAKEESGTPDLGPAVNTANAGGGTAQEQPAGVKTETSKPSRKPKKEKSYDPFPTDGISAEAREAIDGAIAILKDLDATTAIRGAGRTLFEHRKDAIPVLINELYALDLTNEDDVRRGWSLIQELKTCAEHVTGYENTFQVIEWPQDTTELEQAVSRRRTALKRWHEWWTENGEGWEPPVEEEL